MTPRSHIRSVLAASCVVLSLLLVSGCVEEATIEITATRIEASATLELAVCSPGPTMASDCPEDNHVVFAADGPDTATIGIYIGDDSTRVDVMAVVQGEPCTIFEVDFGGEHVELELHVPPAVFVGCDLAVCGVPRACPVFQ